MFNTLLSFIQKAPKNDALVTQRRSPRRAHDTCICIIGDKPYPVENWSIGGALIIADGRLFEVGAMLDVTLKFKVNKGILEVTNSARIIRKSNNKIAIAFDYSLKDSQAKFERIIRSLARG